MRILVGSSAVKLWYPNYREPKDIDFFTDEPDFKSYTEESNGKRVEVFYSPRIVDWFVNNTKVPFFLGDEHNVMLASSDELYTIKVSHAFWSLRNGSWRKHMNDIEFFQSVGASFVQDLYDLLYEIWVERYGAKRANLDKTPEEFFTSTVQRIYDHDSIHASVAYYDVPLFNEILRDGSSVAVSRAKFDALSHQDKCRLVREEVYATALERKVIPSDYEYPPKRAYDWAMFKLITSFSKGWFPLWVVLHYSELKSPEVDYVQRHLDNKSRLVLL